MTPFCPCSVAQYLILETKDEKVYSSKNNYFILDYTRILFICTLYKKIEENKQSVTTVFSSDLLYINP